MDFVRQMWITTVKSLILKRTRLANFYSKKAVLVATAIPENPFPNIRSLILSNIKIIETKTESVSKYIPKHMHIWVSNGRRHLRFSALASIK